MNFQNSHKIKRKKKKKILEFKIASSRSTNKLILYHTFFQMQFKNRTTIDNRKIRSNKKINGNGGNTELAHGL